jgi:hypothetical protein
MRAVGVLDTEGLLRLFAQVAGRRLVGVVDGGGWVELVFSDDGPGGNLVSIGTDAGRHTGLVELGGVADPEHYVMGCGWGEAA